MKYLITVIFALSIISCQEKEESKVNSISSFELEEVGIAEIQEAYKSGKYTIKQVVQLYLNRIEEIDRNGPELNSIIMVNPDALQIAEEIGRASCRERV